MSPSKLKKMKLFLLAVVVKLIIWQLKVQPFNIKIVVNILLLTAIEHFICLLKLVKSLVKVFLDLKVNYFRGLIIKGGFLLEELEKSIQFGKIQEKIYGYFTLSVGKPAKLIVCSDTVSVEAESEIQVEQAGKRPLAEEQVRKQLEKTGETPFIFETLDIGMDPNVFYRCSSSMRCADGRLRN